MLCKSNDDEENFLFSEETASKFLLSSNYNYKKASSLIFK